MNNSIYIAANGANQIMFQQRTVANNMANLNTPGFKQDFQTVYQQQLIGPGYYDSVYSESRTTGHDISSGNMIDTGKPLDFAVSGKGFIALTMPDGSEGYSSSVSAVISSGGVLTAASGEAVIGDSGPIFVPQGAIVNISENGNVLAKLPDQDATLIGRIKTVNPLRNDLTKNNFGFLTSISDDGIDPDISVKIQSGFTQSSNVNMVEQLVNNISLSRQLDANLKVIKITDSLASQMARIMQ